MVHFRVFCKKKSLQATFNLKFLIPKVLPYTNMKRKVAMIAAFYHGSISLTFDCAITCPTTHFFACSNVYVSFVGEPYNVPATASTGIYIGINATVQSHFVTNGIINMSIDNDGANSNYLWHNDNCRPKNKWITII